MEKLDDERGSLLDDKQGLQKQNAEAGTEIEALKLKLKELGQNCEEMEASVQHMKVELEKEAEEKKSLQETMIKEGSDKEVEPLKEVEALKKKVETLEQECQALDEQLVKERLAKDAAALHLQVVPCAQPDLPRNLGACPRAN